MKRTEKIKPVIDKDPVIHPPIFKLEMITWVCSRPSTPVPPNTPAISPR